MDSILGLFVFVLFLTPFVILPLKGRAIHLFWVFVPLCGYWIIVVKACRMARPESIWARKFYDQRRTAAAYTRYDTLTPDRQAAYDRLAMMRPKLDA
jgi:hypothetical protein